jgi:hypothetical protein
MSNTTGYWPRLTLLSFAGIYAISLAWSLSPFVKLYLYPSVCSDPDTKPDAKAVVNDQDPTCGPDTTSQTETSEPEGQDDHPSSHNSHIRQEVCKSRDEPTAISHLQTGMQNELDSIKTTYQSIQPQLLHMSTSAENEGT